MATKQALAWKDKGNAAFKAGKHAEAIEFYTYATELDPNNPIFFTNRSNAYYILKNFDKSARDARKAIKNDSNWAKGHYRLGMALEAMGQHQEGLAAYKTACDLKPDNAAFKKGHDNCKRKMQAGMSDAEILKTDGNLAFKEGQIDKAVKIYSEAISKANSSSQKELEIKVACLANRAACYRQLYLPDKCIEDTTEALKINPTHIKCLLRRGQAYESMEKYEEALADFQKVCTIDFKCQLAFNSATRIRAALKKMGKM